MESTFGRWRWEIADNRIEKGQMSVAILIAEGANERGLTSIRSQTKPLLSSKECGASFGPHVPRISHQVMQ